MIYAPFHFPSWILLNIDDRFIGYQAVSLCTNNIMPIIIMVINFLPHAK